MDRKVMLKKDDRVRIDSINILFDGLYGTVTIDQSYPNGNVMVTLDNGMEITISPNELIYWS